MEIIKRRITTIISQNSHTATPQTLIAKQESKTDLSAEFNTHFAVRKTENGTFPHKIEDPRLENAVFS